MGEICEVGSRCRLGAATSELVRVSFRGALLLDESPHDEDELRKQLAVTVRRIRVRGARWLRWQGRDARR